MRGSLWIILDVCFDWLTFCVCLVLSIFLGFDFTLKLDQLKYGFAIQRYWTYKYFTFNSLKDFEDKGFRKNMKFLNF